MFNTVKRIAVGLAALSISVGAFAQSDRAMDLDALLKQLEEGQFAQSQQNKQRERNFQAQRAEQDRILRETREKRDQMLAQSEQLETQFEENEFKLADLNGALDTRLGSLKELFGVLQQIAGDTKNKFYNSVVSHKSLAVLTSLIRWHKTWVQAQNLHQLKKLSAFGLKCSAK